ncbi:RNA polymerase sigma factor [Actinoplanes regularis]|uniref:RNA polymerase sigma factor n=1 Tax=Actinoplanes regularis TaxID=52697 RepID=UPI0024A2A536|nr:sigma-70 family RNA polymerase sigma factor [Actinoplanes regularis]GLW30998.1 hypothetical protein Areg01_39380 [Actinoplanes regularis]
MSTSKHSAGGGQLPALGDEPVGAQDESPGHRRAGEPAPPWRDLDDGQRKILSDDFVIWFESGARLIFLKAGHSICGREGRTLAGDAAVRCYEQWPDPRKRELFKQSPRYVYQTVRNLFLDELKSGYRRRESPAGLPGHADRIAEIWERPPVGDPGWEVRQAINSLDPEKGEIIFLHYWLKLSWVDAARLMGRSRGQVDRLHRSAIEELRVLLG